LCSLFAPRDMLGVLIFIYGIIILYITIQNANESMAYILYLPFITGPYLQLHSPIRKIVPIDMQTRCVYICLPKYTRRIHFSFLIYPWDNPGMEYVLAIL
jgi:hypothetical protein